MFYWDQPFLVGWVFFMVQWRKPFYVGLVNTLFSTGIKPGESDWISIGSEMPHFNRKRLEKCLTQTGCSWNDGPNSTQPKSFDVVPDSLHYHCHSQPVGPNPCLIHFQLLHSQFLHLQLLRGFPTPSLHLQQPTIKHSLYVCNPCQSSPCLIIFLPWWFIIIVSVIVYVSKLLFSARLQFKGHLVRG